MIPEWLSSLGSNAYNWAGDNPLQALSLGVGAAGTGMGIYDAYQANQRADQRQKLAEQMSKMGPTAYNPNWSPQQLQAMYFRPAATFMAERGITSGGAFNQGLADAALKAEADRNQLGNQIFQSRLGALGYGPPRGPSGSVGGFGQALQNVQLINALRNQNQMPQAPPNAAIGPLSDQLRDQSAFNNWLYDPANQTGNINWNLGYQPGLVGQGGYGLSAVGAGAGDGRWGFNPMSGGGTNASPQIPGTNFYPDNLGF